MRFIGILIDDVTNPSREIEYQFWDNPCMNTEFYFQYSVLFKTPAFDIIDNIMRPSQYFHCVDVDVQ